MKTLKDVKNAKIVYPEYFGDLSKVLIDDTLISSIDRGEYVILPSFCDVHVHFREPGFSHKETIKTGSESALAGGYTAVCTMPNLKPVPDTVENLSIQTELIRNNSSIDIYPYASITMEQKGKELTDIDTLSNHVLAFTDDGKGVQDDGLMEQAMLLAKKNGKIIAAHCEDNSLLFGGYIHDGEYARLHGHKGICSASEYAQVERDLKLVEKTGVKYHVCHVSTKETVDFIRKAKKIGLDVSCETAPHYLTMNDSFLKEDGKFKMNPPIRSEEDRLALVKGLVDGTIELIATDHAPHSKEEKGKGLKDSLFGVVGLETSFSALYTHLVKTGIISLEKLVEVMSINPRRRFNIPFTKDFSVWNLEEKYIVNPEEFKSMGRATPYDGQTLYAKNYATVKNGVAIYKR